MASIKVRKPYNEWIEQIIEHDRIIIRNVGASLYLAKLLKGQPFAFCAPIGHNKFIFQCNRKPRKIKELTKYVVYDI